MLGNLTGWHALIILAIVILLFGAAKLPALAKSVGQSVKILQKEARPEKVESTATVEPAAAVEPAVLAAASATPARTLDE
ncbi:twin-arginine translocase TatA/TatE family subunit [Microbacterium deminutum]|uniref:Sec-independent protein translocase protein TatA n=1 Tax=Microbacterium deminutum TaxID=344164 RepID=A0ABN2RHM2_9MICO